MIFTLRYYFATAALLLAPLSASAETLNFSISGNNLASGNFSFDTVSGTYSNFDVVSPSSGVDYSEVFDTIAFVDGELVATYVPSNPIGDASSVGVVGTAQVDLPNLFCGSLTISFNGALDSASPALLSVTEDVYSDVNCTGTPSSSVDNSGSLQLDSDFEVPIPGIVLVILGAFLCLITQESKWRKGIH